MTSMKRISQRQVNRQTHRKQEQVRKMRSGTRTLLPKLYSLCLRQTDRRRNQPVTVRVTLLRRAGTQLSNRLEQGLSKMRKLLSLTGRRLPDQS